MSHCLVCGGYGGTLYTGGCSLCIGGITAAPTHSDTRIAALEYALKACVEDARRRRNRRGAERAEVSALFHCVVMGKPVPQGRARTTRFGTFYPRTSKAWRKTLTYEFATATGHINFGVAVSLLVEVAGMRANSDLDNHAKIVLDALQDAGVLASDDVRTVRELVVRVVEGDPRTEVTIRTMDVSKPDAKRRPKQEKTK